MLGSIDANRGDYQNGWDTDQFPINIYELVESMLVIVEAGGFQGGGINFDAKIRRNSTDVEDLFLAHIGGMDAFARGLKTAAAIRADGELERFVKERYSSWDRGIGREIESGRADMRDLEEYMLDKGDVSPNHSGRQEMLENLINRYLDARLFDS